MSDLGASYIKYLLQEVYFVKAFLYFLSRRMPSPCRICRDSNAAEKASEYKIRVIRNKDLKLSDIKILQIQHRTFKPVCVSMCQPQKYSDIFQADVYNHINLAGFACRSSKWKNNCE